MRTIKGSIKFNRNDTPDFYQELRRRVDNYFKENNMSHHANAAMIFKTIVILSLYFVPFFLLCTTPMSIALQFVCWILVGLGLAGIGMSIMHDAIHGAYSSHPLVNRLLGYTLNLVGGSVFNWKNQHNIMHHTYTNMVHFDEDIDDKLILRMSPHTEVKKVHRFQYLYAFAFYGIITIYWALLKDFIQFHRHIKHGVNPQSRKKNIITLTRIIFAKIFYFTYMIVLPCMFADVSVGLWLSGFMVMHLVAGFVLTIIFQLAHTVEGTQHPLPDESGSMENNWAIHQLCTTVDFARNNRLLRFYVGGLNFQIEHHLFPKICHIHYHKLAPIVQQTAREYGIPYLYNDTFMSAVGSHIRTLRRFGFAENELM